MNQYSTIFLILILVVLSSCETFNHNAQKLAHPRLRHQHSQTFLELGSETNWSFWTSNKKVVEQPTKEQEVKQIPELTEQIEAEPVVLKVEEDLSASDRPESIFIDAIDVVAQKTIIDINASQLVENQFQDNMSLSYNPIQSTADDSSPMMNNYNPQTKNHKFIQPKTKLQRIKGDDYSKFEENNHPQKQ